MKYATLVVAGAGALAATMPVLAGYSGLDYVSVDYADSGDDSLFVCQIFAVFTNPADTVLSVFGDSTNPIALSTDDPNGFISTVGGDLPPNSTLFSLVPAAQWDSFYTIGRASFDGSVESSAGVLTIGVSELGGQTSFGSTNGTWFTSGPQPQGAASADGRVLLAQLTIRDGYSISGVFNLQWDPNGPGGNDYTLEYGVPVNVPGPGSLAVLALASALRCRRRR
jgi:hypothetical protein